MTEVEKRRNVTKADIVAEVSESTGLQVKDVQNVVEGFIRSVKSANMNGDNVQIRGFGSFILKKRAQKIARHLTENTSVTVAEHYTPVFKPSKEYSNPIKVKSGYAVSKKEKKG